MNKKYEWNISNIYIDFYDKNFTDDLKLLECEIDKLYKLSNEIKQKNKNDIDCIEKYIYIENSLCDIYSKLSSYTNLVLSTDSENKDALKYNDIIENILTKKSIPETNISKWLYSLNYDFEKIYNESEIINKHKYFIKTIIENNKYDLSENEEKIISRFKITGSNSWEKLWESITSNHTVNIKNNTQIPLSEVRNMAYSSDVNTRKIAYECELKSYEKIAQTSAYCLNAIKGQVIAECSIRGYENPLSMTTKHSRIDNDILNTMIEAINESLPYFEKYFIKKSKLLGHKNGLPFYDLFAPVGKNNITFTYESAMEFIIENFYKFSKNLGEYSEKAYKEKWIDVYPKKGKRGGAFCDNIHSINESRILINFTGSFSDVITIAHELGHGYHGQCLNNETPINSDYPMPIAETASTFCETIVKNSAIKNADNETKIMILESDLQDNSQVIVDILSRFIFEDTVFNERKKYPLSVNELCDIMIEAQHKAYGKGLDKNYMHKYMWICKPHYYDANYNYYNFPYAFGLLLSKGLYALYEKSTNTFPDIYDKFLMKTGSDNIKNVAKSVGIDITKKDFWNSSLDIIKRDINTFMEL